MDIRYLDPPYVAFNYPDPVGKTHLAHPYCQHHTNAKSIVLRTERCITPNSIVDMDEQVYEWTRCY